MKPILAQLSGSAWAAGASFVALAAVLWPLEARARAENFGNLAPWTDLLFGTYHRPTGDETWSLGVDGGLPRSYVGMLLSPLAPARRQLPSAHPAASR